MPDINTPEQILESNRNSAIHQPFSWLGKDAKDYPLADFLALTLDASRGIQTCLEIAHMSDLVRSSNAEMDPEEAEVPAVNAYDAGKLVSTAIVTSRLLQEYAVQKLLWINQHGPGHLQAMKSRAK